MKNVYLIQNSNLSFDMDISKIFSPKKYSLILITNGFCLKKLKSRNQIIYFDKIFETNDFSFDNLKALIVKNQSASNKPLDIVTNAEEAIIVCGNLRIFFDIEKINYDRFNNKIIMKKLINNKGLLTPNHMIFDKISYQNNPTHYINQITTRLPYPLIAKPIDAWGCIGIQKLDSIDQLSKWCESICNLNITYEIDEYIEGDLSPRIVQN